MRWWRRPLLAAVVFGCMISLLTSARVTLRLAGPAAIYFSFVPLCEIGSLAVVWRRNEKISLARAIDLFFIGQTPWLLWLTGFAAVWAFFSPVRVFGWEGHVVFERSAMLVAVWSAYIDFWFFRRVFRRTPARALGDLALQRLLAWSAGMWVFVASAGWQVLATKVGL